VRQSSDPVARAADGRHEAEQNHQAAGAEIATELEEARNNRYVTANAMQGFSPARIRGRSNKKFSYTLPSRRTPLATTRGQRKAA
jgi:hypothetical protein